MRMLRIKDYWRVDNENQGDNQLGLTDVCLKNVR